MKRNLAAFAAILFWMVISFLSGSPLDARKQSEQTTKKGETEQKEIIETVTVKNVRVAVRVYEGKKPAHGLEKKDFNLLINGKSHPINVFYTIKKELPVRTQDTVATPRAVQRPRLFVLLFNISSHRQDLSDILDVFFKKVLRKGDRLMVLTNHFYFPAWEIDSVEKTYSEIIALLQKEINLFKEDMTRLDMELKSQAISLKSEISEAEMMENSDPMGGLDMSYNIATYYRNFFLTYNFILEDIRARHLGFPAGHYIKIARYLQNRDMEKWVINFFQVGRLPMLDPVGELNLKLKQFTEGDNGKKPLRDEAAKEVHRLYQDFLQNIAMREDHMLKDIGKIFLNSGATFHTMLIHPPFTGISSDFSYKPRSTQAEILLKKLTKQTGGSMLQSNKIDRFIDKISAKKDTIYVLSYVPPAGVSHKEKIEITVNTPPKKKYRLVYDNQDRIKAFRQAENKVDREQPDLQIEKLAFGGQALMVKLNNIKQVLYDGKEFGVIKARVIITRGPDSTVASFEKVFRGISNQGVFQAKLPALPRGKYNVLLEVKDVFSLDDKYISDTIDITIN